MKKIIIVGAGAAGLIAAITAAQNGAHVTLIEQKDRIGRKLMITGKGRCNITNTADKNTFIKNIPGNGKFLYSAFDNFFNEDTIEFFNNIGVPTKIERGGRVFPQSDSAVDVVNRLKEKICELNVDLRLNTKVTKIIVENTKIIGVETDHNEILQSDIVIMAAGGASYPLTGSDGSGFVLAEQVGHTIKELTPSLVPLESDTEWIKILQGLSLRNVRLTVYIDNKKTEDVFGEMMFTHFGVTGPLILSVSRKIAMALKKDKDVYLSINLKPALTPEQIEARIQRDFIKYTKKQIKNAMIDLLPHKMIPIILDLAYIDGEKQVNDFSKKERMQLVEILRSLPIDITNTRPLAEAIVTCGGVNVKEINPKTMQSKIIDNLYFAGEIVDIDGYTGGYNLQAAFSMAYAAAQAATQE